MNEFTISTEALMQKANDYEREADAYQIDILCAEIDIADLKANGAGENSNRIKKLQSKIKGYYHRTRVALSRRDFFLGASTY